MGGLQSHRVGCGMCVVRSCLLFRRGWSNILHILPRWQVLYFDWRILALFMHDVLSWKNVDL